MKYYPYILVLHMVVLVATLWCQLKTEYSGRNLTLDTVYCFQLCTQFDYLWNTPPLETSNK